VLCALGEDLDTARAVAGRLAEKIREVHRALVVLDRLDADERTGVKDE